MPTRIQVGSSTLERLQAIRREGETYDALIRRLLKSAGYAAQMEEQYSLLAKPGGWKLLRDLP